MRLLRRRVSPKSNNKSTAENKNKLQKGNNKLLLPQSTSLPLPQSTATQSDDHSLCIFKFSVSVRFGTLNKTCEEPEICLIFRSSEIPNKSVCAVVQEVAEVWKYS
ncbi:uncharacterized protein [Drosophila suzukii]|uniref:Uncharacterized protein n=1 Tax=Drosophila suzukii TaxID=28584 RepID=A0ABM4TKN9_DROSZ